MKPKFPKVKLITEVSDSAHYWIRFQYDYLKNIKVYGKWRIMQGDAIKRIEPETAGFDCEGPILRD